MLPTTYQQRNKADPLIGASVPVARADITTISAAAAPSRFTDPTGEILPCLAMNYMRCMATCAMQAVAMHAISNCGDLDLGQVAKDCALSCLVSMLPIPDPCGKFGMLLSIGAGMLANSFQGDTPVHVRVLTDSGYLLTTKKIKDIQVGDEVLAWDELASHDSQVSLQQSQRIQAWEKLQNATQASENPKKHGKNSPIGRCLGETLHSLLWK